MSRHIHLLGTLAITDDGTPSKLLRNAKGCALLAYLIVRGRSETREHLGDLFWDSVDTASNLRNLRVLLSRIRPFLPGLEITRNSVRYIPQPDETIDFLILSDALTLRESHPSLDVLRLYRGEMFEGFYLEDAPRYMEWLTLQRERVRRAVLDAHHNLCEALANDKLWQEGAEAAAHWLTIDELDDTAVRWQLQFLAAKGQITAARQAYALFQKNLGEQLGLEPEATTAALAQKLEDWNEGALTLLLPDLTTLEALSADKLPEPGPLPSNSILPYHRNVNFVGRAGELLQVASALRDTTQHGRVSAVAITGMSGLGKTQTAVEFCYRYGRYFLGGVFWLNFSEAENVAEEVAASGSERGLGLFSETDNLTLSDQIGRVRRAWQEPVPRLLIFDNCEDETLLESWLPVTGGCRVILTSLQKEWASELNVTAVSLAVLNPLESRRLLGRLAEHIDETDAADIAQEVGHLPLALHLAGSFLRRYQQISPASYMAQLRHAPLIKHPSLRGHGTSHSPTGHELSLVQTYTLNWEKLDPADEVDVAARKLLLHAACLVSSEPIQTRLLRATLSGETEDLMMTLMAEDGLSRLVALGFLEREGENSVVLHQLLASFTREINGAEAVRLAQTTITAKIVQTILAHHQKEGHLSTLPISAIHVRYVTDMAIRQSVPQSALLASLLGLHLESIGNLAEAEQILKRACRTAEEMGDILGWAQALSALSSTQEGLGREEDSLHSAQQAVGLFKEAAENDTGGLIQVLYYQGWAHYRLGQAEAALHTAKEGLALSQSADLERAKARFLSLMGVVNYYVLSQYDEAQQQLQESLTLYRKLGYKQGQSVTLNNMGENARLQGDYALAGQYYEEALAIAREIESHKNANIFLSNLCGTRLRLGQFAVVADDLEALITNTAHDWYGLSETYRFLAEAYLGLGKTSQALEMAQQALALAPPSDLFDNGRAWQVLGLVAAQLGQPVRSDLEIEQWYDVAACYGRSLDFFQGGDFQRDRAITLWRWGQHELGVGNETQGRAMWQEAREIFYRLNIPLMAVRMGAG